MGHQGHLFLPFFAHFVLAPFSVFAVILVVCGNSNILQSSEKYQHKMRFFYFFGKL
jgi:hypothetical protein